MFTTTGYYGYILQNSTDGYYYISAIISETLGAFFVVFFYLTQTESKTVFSKEPAINCFIIASAYVGGRGMMNGFTITLSGAVLNPAIGVAVSLIQLFKSVEQFKYVWIYGLFPFAGAVIAVLFHEFVFKKTQEVLHEEEEDDPDSLLEK